MKIAILVGSIRKESLNMKLANTIKDRYMNKFNTEILDIRNLPYYDQDIETTPPESVKDFKQKVKEADGIIIITPEYNWSIPGVLKNALDWLSRVDQVLIGKPTMTAGVSPGLMGTIRAQLHLREILAAPGVQAKLLKPAGNEVLINLAASKFDEITGELVDKVTLKFLDEVIERFITLVSQR